MEIRMYGVDGLDQRLAKMLREFPERRAEVAQEIADKILREVQSGAGGGKVAGWQASFVGSKSGYAAVRPQAKTYQETKQGRRYAVGHVTTAIEVGHKVRPPSGRSKRYQPRLEKTRVPGKGFYLGAESQLASLAQAAAEQFVAELAAEVEG